MQKYKLVKNNNTYIRKKDDNYSIKNYLTKDFNKNFSLAVSTMLDGEHELTKSTLSDRIYYFIEADVIFNIDGESVSVSNEDVLFIPKDVWYSFSGKFKAVLINIPAFGIEDDKYKLGGKK